MITSIFPALAAASSASKPSRSTFLKADLLSSLNSPTTSQLRSWAYLRHSHCWSGMLRPSSDSRAYVAARMIFLSSAPLGTKPGADSSGTQRAADDHVFHSLVHAAWDRARHRLGRLQRVRVAGSVAGKPCR